MSEEVENEEKVMLKTGRKIMMKILILILIIMIIGGLIAGFCMIIFKNDSADSSFKDNKKEWEDITENFKTD